MAMNNATETAPLKLKGKEDRWWLKYYTAGSIKQRERQLFVR